MQMSYHTDTPANTVLNKNNNNNDMSKMHNLNEKTEKDHIK